MWPGGSCGRDGCIGEIDALEPNRCVAVDSLVIARNSAGCKAEFGDGRFDLCRVEQSRVEAHGDDFAFQVYLDVLGTRQFTQPRLDAFGTGEAGDLADGELDAGKPRRPGVVLGGVAHQRGKQEADEKEGAHGRLSGGGCVDQMARARTTKKYAFSM